MTTRMYDGPGKYARSECRACSGEGSYKEDGQRCERCDGRGWLTRMEIEMDRADDDDERPFPADEVTP